MLVFSTTLAMTSSNWSLIWMGLELNTLTVCYFLSAKNSSVVAKYLLIQALASSVILVATSLGSMTVTELAVPLALLTKMGSWPAHLWYMNLFRNMSTDTKIFLIIMVWQKIAPIYLLSFSCSSETIFMFLIVCALLSAASPFFLMKKNLPSKDNMILSSVNNNGWFIITMIFGWGAFLSYILLYFYPLKLMIVTVKKMASKKSFLLKNSWQNFLMTLNLSGFPPFTMFWAKLMVMKSAVEISSSWFIPTFLLVTSCLMSYIYLWMSLSVSHQTTKKNMNNLSEKNNSKKIILSSMLGLLVVALLGSTQSDLSW